MTAPNPMIPPVMSATYEEPSRWAGNPLPEDKFAKVGKCASTGKNITICYQTYGNPRDPCLLLVIGLGAQMLLWNPALIERFVQLGFYVVCYDNRDVGLSTHLDGFPTVFIPRMILPRWASIGEGNPPYTLDDMADDGLNLLTALNIEKAHVLGESMGGMIVQCMALRHPERVKSLTIVYSHSGGPKVKPQTFGMSLAMLKEPASYSFEDQMKFKMEMARLFAGDYPVDERRVRDVSVAMTKRCPKEDDAGSLRQVWATQRAKSRVKGLQKMTNIPTLIIHGMMDTMIPFENGLQLAKLIKGSRLVAFARMGHSLRYELFDDIAAEVALQKERGEARAAAAGANDAHVRCPENKSEENVYSDAGSARAH